MENVPQVMSADNIKDFHSWCDFLENKGYKCYSEILNAKDYGVAQNRERAFMVSILGDYNYKFPQPIPLKTTMKDYLEPEVDERYYINSAKAKKMIVDLIGSGQLSAENPPTEPTAIRSEDKETVSDSQMAASQTQTEQPERERQPISVGNKTNPKLIDNGMCVTARYYKGLSNYDPENAVLEKDGEN